MYASGTETFHRNDVTWAYAIQNAALATLGLKDRGVKLESQSQHARLAVMDFPGKACLLEIGFITHSTDRAKMLMRDNRVKFATELLKLWKGMRS
jgi:N-acetylmuramoyl-L-alanine amidase